MKSTEFVTEYKKNRKAPKFNIKPRTGHAPTQTGAGAHKDKKKAEKQGDVKHKKKAVEESYQERLIRRLDELGIDTLKSYKEKSKAWSDKEKETDPNPERGSEAWMKRVYRAQGRSTAQRKINQKERGVTVGDQNEDITTEGPLWRDARYADNRTGFGRSERDWDEGDTEPPNNFAIYINGKKWKVFKGNGYHADDFREKNHLRQLKAMCDKKTAATGKKWEVYVTGEAPTE
jgi:hypothetical protein